MEHDLPVCELDRQIKGFRMVIAGFVSEKALSEWPDASVLLPQFQFYEKHSALINTPHPENILPAIANIDIKEDVVIRTLMSIRQWPQKVLRRPIASFGLHSFARLKSTETELCFGLKGAFWRSDFGLEAIPDVEAWLAPSAPGGAKLLLRYRVTEDAEAQYQLCTETYIHCPDRATWLKMTAYWIAIRAGSGWIRRRMLRSVQTRLLETSERV
jgi:hypothetical protein